MSNRLLDMLKGVNVGSATGERRQLLANLAVMYRTYALSFGVSDQLGRHKLSQRRVNPAFTNPLCYQFWVEMQGFPTLTQVNIYADGGSPALSVCSEARMPLFAFGHDMFKTNYSHRRKEAEAEAYFFLCWLVAFCKDRGYEPDLELPNCGNVYVMDGMAVTGQMFDTATTEPLVVTECEVTPQNLRKLPECVRHLIPKTRFNQILY